MGEVEQFGDWAGDRIRANSDILGGALLDPKRATDRLGLTNHAGEAQAREDAKKASDDANQIARENMEFQRKQYEDWKGVYGDIEKNLSNYYENLGPERIASLGLQEQQKAHQNSVQQIKRNMAQRGLGGSKFESYVQSMADVDNANRRATIRATAEERSAQQQMSFLGLGLGQGTQMMGQINNAAGMGVNSYMNQSNMYNQQFNQMATNNSAMTRQLVDTGSEVAGANRGRYVMSDKRLKQNIVKLGQLNGHNIYTYQFKSDPKKTHMGVLAQEVEKTKPDAVIEIDGVKHVNYNSIFHEVQHNIFF